LNGALGFAALIALLFSIGDIESALTSPTGYPFIQVFYNATKSRAGTTVMTCIIIVLIICATFGYVAAAFRQLWAFARDRAVPFSGTLAKVCLQSLLLGRAGVSPTAL
jgi:choline transport protein